MVRIMRVHIKHGKIAYQSIFWNQEYYNTQHKVAENKLSDKRE